MHKNILVTHLYKYTIVSKNKFILDIRCFYDILIAFFGLINLRVPYSMFQKQLSGQPKGVIFTEIDSIDEEFRESSLRRGTWQKIGEGISA